MTAASLVPPDVHLLTAADVLAVMERSTDVIITTHVNPDGDALGSELALATHFRGRGKCATVLNTSAVPENLSFLDIGGILQQYDPLKHRNLLRAADSIFVLDLNQSGRLRSMEADVLAASARKIVIDHHLEPRPFADAYHIVPDASATAEILYDLLMADGSAPLAYEIALGLYVGLMTDTGSFRFERTTPRVHRMAAELLDAGVDPVEVYRRIHDDYPVGRTRLLGRILSRLELIADGRATILTVPASDIRETGTSQEDVENVVNFGLGIRGVDATALLTETAGGVKISFRSRGGVSVYPLAISFGGGGHRYAAGATIDGAVISDVVREVERRLTELVSAAACQQTRT